MFAPITALFAAAALLPGLASATVLSGSGTISVLNSSSFMTATPDMNIGCVDATGKLVMDGCATFTFRDTYPYGVSTSAGNCSFTNSSQQANTDSRYGANSYAWSCWPHDAAVTDQIYTIVGCPSPIIDHSPPTRSTPVSGSLFINCEITTDHAHRLGRAPTHLSLPGRHELLL